MARITYIGAEADTNGVITWHGQAFERNRAVDTDHPGLIAAAKGNRFFEVVGDEPEAEEDEEVDGFTVKRRQAGKYAVMKGDEVVADGLTKSEAEQHARDLGAPAV